MTTKRATGRLEDHGDTLKTALDHGPWDTGNDWLYELCERHPSHTSIDEIVAKTWIIGHAYSAQPKRLASSTKKGTVEWYPEVLAEALKSSQIDTRLGDLRGSLAKETVRDCLDVHASFVQALNRVTDRSPRSFASKYLHFHRPAWFPIYDSISQRAIQSLVPLKEAREYARFARKDEEDFDPPYARYVIRTLLLKEKLERSHPRVIEDAGRKGLTLRDIDWFLQLLPPARG